MKYYNLQLLRFIAASAVIFFHKFIAHIVIVDFFIQRGDCAVSLFFILSGFVIANSLIAKPSSFIKYVKRRAVKIYPQWLLSIFLSLAIGGGVISSVLRCFLCFLLLQSIYPAFSLDINFVGWSLSVEMLMYLVMYIVITYSNIRSRWYDILTWAIWLVTQVVIIYLFTKDTGTNTDWSYFLKYNPIWHLNVFLLGILFCKYLPKAKTLKFVTYPYATTIVTAGYVLLIFALFYIGYKMGVPKFYHDGFLAPLTGLYIMLLAAIESKKRVPSVNKTKWNKLFDLLGAASFGMYLFHMPIYYFLNPLIHIGNGGYKFFLYYLLVIGFSYVAYLIFDKGLHRLLYKK